MWYDRFFVYAAGDDYTVSITTGEITRKPTGAIADGQTVLVDYVVALGSVSDAMVEQAITESGEAVLALVATPYHEAPTQGLVIGATHWAVAAVCRMRAGATLADSGIASSVARAAAETWLGLAAQYDQTGRSFLSRFASAQPSLRAGRNA